MNLQYQTDAVIQAKKILDAYNGVFISDVVGLGKTFICAMLAQKLKGRKTGYMSASIERLLGKNLTAI